MKIIQVLLGLLLSIPLFLFFLNKTGILDWIRFKIPKFYKRWRNKNMKDLIKLVEDYIYATHKLNHMLSGYSDHSEEVENRYTESYAKLSEMIERLKRGEK